MIGCATSEEKRTALFGKLPDKVEAGRASPSRLRASRIGYANSGTMVLLLGGGEKGESGGSVHGNLSWKASALGPAPVSYTHLTLPTILRV